MKILGIEVRSSKIKAVEVDSAFGKHEVRDYHETRVQPEETPERATYRLIEHIGKKFDRVAVALDTSHTTFRNIELPTRDKKAIRSAIIFELEDELPFEIDDTSYDYSVIAQSKNSSEIHVAATLKKHLFEFLHRFNIAGVDPDVVTTEPWAYHTYFNRLLSQGKYSSPTLLVQMGSHSTSLYVHFKGRPLLLKKISWGGDKITKALSQYLNVDWEEAEKIKLNNGFVLSESQLTTAKEDQQEFSKVIIESLQGLLSELRQAHLICKSTIGKGIDTIYVSGRTALLPGLKPVIEETLGVPTYTLQSLSTIAQSGVAYSEQADLSFLLPASIALSVVGARNGLINFRKGDFAKAGNSFEFSFDKIRRPAMMGGTVIASLALSLIVQSIVYEGKIDSVDEDLSKGIKRFFGTSSASAVRSYLSNTTRLKTSIEEEISQQREMAEISRNDGKTPLNFLKEISEAIQKDIVVDMTEFRVGQPPEATYDSEAIRNAEITFLLKDKTQEPRLFTVLRRLLVDVKKSATNQVKKSDEDPGSWQVTYTGRLGR